MYSVNLEKAEQHAAQAPTLREQIYPLTFDSVEVFKPELRTEGRVTGCGL